MSEEQACLVSSARDTSGGHHMSFGSIEKRVRIMSESNMDEHPMNNGVVRDVSMGHIVDTNDSGELIDGNDTGNNVISQFHEDALRQAGSGYSQLKSLFTLGLALAGHSIEYSVVQYILPSAEMEFCILDLEKNWLGIITFLGMALGGPFWGFLADRIGRKSALTSCLAVNLIFSLIAAFMPTYGTFMMARLCSAMGSGGIVPTVFPLISEQCSRDRRHTVVSLLLAFVGIGQLYVVFLAEELLPSTGRDVFIDNNEHFSAWHKYLLLCTLPVLGSLVFLIWNYESPLYLLENSREVEALAVYQEIHTNNAWLRCDKSNDYRVSQLELPAKQLPNKRRTLVDLFRSLMELLKPPYVSTTLASIGVLFLAMFVQFTIITYSPAALTHMDAVQFERSKTHINNARFTSQQYTNMAENIEYANSTFEHCTFKDMYMSHVQFINCTFVDVLFSNVRSSFSGFSGCKFINSSLVDAAQLQCSWCTWEGGMSRGVREACDVRAPRLVRRPPFTPPTAAVLAAIMASLLHKITPRTALVVTFALSCLTTPALYFANGETMIFSVECVYRFLLTIVFYIILLRLLNTYPNRLRCSIIGIVYCGASTGAACGSGVDTSYATVAATLTAIMSILAAVTSIAIPV